MAKKKRNLCLICKQPRPISSWFCPKCEALVKAAPELLEACKAALIELSGLTNGKECKMLAQAIAKAEGK